MEILTLNNFFQCKLAYFGYFAVTTLNANTTFLMIIMKVLYFSRFNLKASCNAVMAPFKYISKCAAAKQFFSFFSIKATKKLKEAGVET